MIQVFINGITMPPLEVDFVNQIIEKAADVDTLDGNVYTDFTSQASAWSLHYDSLSEAQYNAIRAIYNAQFSSKAFPLLTIPHYGVTNKPARMSINDRDIYNHCGDIKNVNISFRESAQLSSGVI